NQRDGEILLLFLDKLNKRHHIWEWTFDAEAISQHFQVSRILNLLRSEGLNLQTLDGGNLGQPIKNRRADSFSRASPSGSGNHSLRSLVLFQLFLVLHRELSLFLARRFSRASYGW